MTCVVDGATIPDDGGKVDPVFVTIASKHVGSRPRYSASQISATVDLLKRKRSAPLCGLAFSMMWISRTAVVLLARAMRRHNRSGTEGHAKGRRAT